MTNATHVRGQVGSRALIVPTHTNHLSTPREIRDQAPCRNKIPRGVEPGDEARSILGPLLFLIYINDLPDSVLFSKPLLFADDTKCLISSTKDVSSHNMQQDLDSLYQWIHEF